MHPVISWFEIPAADFERGIRFYETVLGVSLQRETSPRPHGGEPMRLAIFPYQPDAGVGGAICHMADGQPPGPAGTLVYLYGGDDLSVPLARVEAAGGRVVVPKTLIKPEIGYFAIFGDSEGNHVGLYSMH